MPSPATDPTRRRARRQLAALAVAVTLVLAAVGLLTVRLLDHRAPDTGAGTLGSQSVPPSPSSPSARAAAAGGDVRWQDVAGVRLPFSPAHGPRNTGRGRAAGYARTPLGAALAAVQVLARTSTTAGPGVYRPVLTSQVTGANAGALARRVDEQYQQLRRAGGGAVRDGDPVPGNNATVAGYLLDSYDEAAGTALVEVLLGSGELPSGQVIAFALDVQWTGGDWRVVAPPAGDWGTLARTLPGTPSGTLEYGQDS
jgi:hypothetical protein